MAAIPQESGAVNEAITTYQLLLNDNAIWRDYWDILGIKARYYLALAYEEIGRTDEAAEMYADFLDLWREGDSDIPELKDAAARLSRLNQSP